MSLQPNINMYRTQKPTYFVDGGIVHHSSNIVIDGGIVHAEDNSASKLNNTGDSNQSIQARLNHNQSHQELRTPNDNISLCSLNTAQNQNNQPRLTTHNNFQHNIQTPLQHTSFQLRTGTKELFSRKTPNLETFDHVANGISASKDAQGATKSYLLNVNQLKLQGLSGLRLEFASATMPQHISTNVDLSKLAPNALVKVNVNHNESNTNKMISVDVGKVHTSTGLSRNPLKLFKNMRSSIGAITPRFKTSKEQTKLVAANSRIRNTQPTLSQLDTTQQQEYFYQLKFGQSHEPNKTGINFNIAATHGAQNAEGFINQAMQNPGVMKLTSLIPGVKVNLSNQLNKFDSHWEQTYGIQNFVSQATGGNGQVTFYNFDNSILQNGFDRSINTLNHELGHVVASTIYGSTDPAPNSEYAKAIQHDGGTQTHISNYGRVAIAEDFAESMRCYFESDPIQKQNFMQQNPNRYQAIDNIVNKRGDGISFAHS